MIVQAPKGEDSGSASRRQILIVEDEIIVALELEHILTQAGFGVVGPVVSVAAALALLNLQRPDAAVLDVNLGGERVTPVAQALRAMSIPFILASAYGPRDLACEPTLSGVKNIGKLIQPAQLVGAVSELLQAR